MSEIEQEDIGLISLSFKIEQWCWQLKQVKMAHIA